MDKLTFLVNEADKQVDQGNELLDEGKTRDAYVSIAQAVHMYHEGNEF